MCNCQSHYEAVLTSSWSQLVVVVPSSVHQEIPVPRSKSVTIENKVRLKTAARRESHCCWASGWWEDTGKDSECSPASPAGAPASLTSVKGSGGREGRRVLAQSPEEGSDKVVSLQLCRDTEKQVLVWLRFLGCGWIQRGKARWRWVCFCAQNASRFLLLMFFALIIIRAVSLNSIN